MATRWFNLPLKKGDLIRKQECSGRVVVIEYDFPYIF